MTLLGSEPTYMGKYGESNTPVMCVCSCHISKASVEEFGFGLDDIGVFRDAEGNVAVVKDSIHQGTGTPGRTARDRKSKHYHPTVAATNFVS